MKHSFIVLSFIVIVTYSLGAAEFNDGQLRLTINEATGRFSLYSLNSGRPAALFSDKDPRTSFLSVIVNDRLYKMGDSVTFRTRLDESGPALIFESSFMTVKQEFSFVKGPGAANSVKITITLENSSDREYSTGARFLLDTALGEAYGGEPIFTNRRTLNTETLINRYDGDTYWTDREDMLSLSGSINTGSPEDPDSVHIANWKKLSDVTWKAPYQSGRNFNSPPYSLRDTAVCYYFEPRALGRGEKMKAAFFLGMNLDVGFEGIIAASRTSIAPVIPVISAFDVDEPLDEPLVEVRVPVSAPEETNSPLQNSREEDLEMLRILIARIETHIAEGTGTDGELNELEVAVDMLRAKYGLGYR